MGFIGNPCDHRIGCTRERPAHPLGPCLPISTPAPALEFEGGALPFLGGYLLRAQRAPPSPQDEPSLPLCAP